MFVAVPPNVKTSAKSSSASGSFSVENPSHDTARSLFPSGLVFVIVQSQSIVPGACCVSGVQFLSTSPFTERTSMDAVSKAETGSNPCAVSHVIVAVFVTVIAIIMSSVTVVWVATAAT